ncbi:MAG: bis(5'-nucleosyl)-tetraphosphatase (symmetrical) YqeK [bacterium]|nr:bis(5'-nucleosyl)-tetraphosphatase (symmetrical) YqeK [bacterium]
MTEKEMKEKLKSVLKPKRYIHSLGVCDTAVKLAKQFGVDKEKAYLAGLLHDCAKCFEHEKQLELCKEYGIELSGITLECPAVIHAPLGAAVARAEYGIDDEEILQSIALHTTGGCNMTKLDKIIYIADMIEPSRDYKGVDGLRKEAGKDLDSAMLTALQSTLKFNIKKGSIIHPDTIDAWNDLLIHKESD